MSPGAELELKLLTFSLFERANDLEAKLARLAYGPADPTEASALAVELEENAAALARLAHDLADAIRPNA